MKDTCTVHRRDVYQANRRSAVVLEESVYKGMKLQRGKWSFTLRFANQVVSFNFHLVLTSRFCQLYFSLNSLTPYYCRVKQDVMYRMKVLRSSAIAPDAFLHSPIPKSVAWWTAT